MLYGPAKAWSIAFLIASCARFAPAAEAAACVAADPGEPVRIATAIDGDTVILSDSTHVRLIGIDTPEIGHHGDASEPGAIEARAFLVSLLAAAGSVRLVHDAEPQDRYGRRLAHLFTDSRANVQARLLAEGYAVPLTVPPNLLFADCYRDATAAAREAGRGLWGLPRYHPVAAGDLDADARGYHVVRGRVTHVAQGTSSIWLEFTPQFAVRIANEDRPYFDALNLAELVGQVVQVQGRIYSAGGQLRVRIRHPLDLTLSSETPRNH